MKKLITLLSVLLAFSIFVVPTYAAHPGSPEGISVSVTNEPTVHIGSMPEAVEQEPLQVTFYEHWESAYEINEIVLVPETKRLVIEFISIIINLPIATPTPQQLIDVSIITTVNGVLGYHYIPPLVELSSSDSIGTNYRGSQQVRIYADPDTSVDLSLGRTHEDFDGTFSVTISGYYIPVP